MNLFSYSILCIFLISAAEMSAAELVPAPFQLPRPPGNETSISRQKNDERPYFDRDSNARVDIDLRTDSLIPNCLLFISIGRDLSFFPVEQCRIYFPSHQKGIKGNVLVRIGDQKILFKHATDEQYNTFFKSWNCQHFSIRRKETRLAVLDNKQRIEYLFSTLDSGYTWILDEIRDIDFSERCLKLEYNDKDLLKSIILPDNSKYSIEYNKIGLVSKVTDPDGLQSTIKWDDKNHIREIKSYVMPGHPFHRKEKDKADATKSPKILIRSLVVECDSAGKLLSLINSNGEKYTIEYRSDSKDGTSLFCGVMKNPDNTQEFCRTVWKQEKKEGDSKIASKTLEISKGNLTYDGKGKENFETLETRTYEKKGNGYSESIEDRGVKSNINFNSDGTISDFTDSKDQTTKYSYNERGGKASVIYPDDTLIFNNQQYDDNYRMTNKTDEKGLETIYTYDDLGHLAEVNESGLITKYQYDVEGKLPVKTILPDGSSHSFSWDKLFRMTSHVLPDGNMLKYGYAGRSDKLIEITAFPPDRKTSEIKKITYTPGGLLEQILFPDGKFEKYQFKGSCLIKFTDREGKITSYTYDSMQRKTSEQASDGKKNIFKYDARENLVEMQIEGRVFQDEYDPNGRLIKRTNPDKSWVSFSYDEMGRKVKERYSDRTETTFKYDCRGRIVSIAGSHADNLSYIYSEKGLLASTTLIKISDPEKKEITTTYSYDELGKKTNTIFPDGSEEKIFYPGNDVIHLSNGEITYSKYDSCGRISAVSKYPLELFEKAATEEDKYKVFENNIVKKYSYNLIGDLLGIENISKTQITASAK